MEPEMSSPCSLQPATYPNPEPDEFNPSPAILPILRYILILSSFQVVSRPQVSPPKPSPFPPHTCHVPRASNFSFLMYSPVLIIIGKHYRFRRSCSCSVFHSPVTSSLLGPNIFFSTLFSNTLSLCPSLSVRDQVWYQYKTRGEIIWHFVIKTKTHGKKIPSGRWCTNFMSKFLERL